MSSSLLAYAACYHLLVAAILLCTTTTTSALYVHTQHNTSPRELPAYPASHTNPGLSAEDLQPQRFHLDEGEGRELLQYLLSKSGRLHNSLSDDAQPRPLQVPGAGYFKTAKRGGDLEEVPTKRFTEFGLPYYKYKRNNGIWIWMPAQGYVSVPKDQQALTNGEAAKQGKIMRYGK